MLLNRRAINRRSINAGPGLPTAAEIIQQVVVILADAGRHRAPVLAVWHIPEPSVWEPEILARGRARAQWALPVAEAAPVLLSRGHNGPSVQDALAALVALGVA